MSSGLYSFGSSFHHTHSSSEMLSSDGELAFLSDPFPFFNNNTNDFSHHNSTNNQNQNPLFDEVLPSSSSSADPFSTCFFSFSPPSTHLESLNIQGNREFASFSGFDGSEAVKSEECQIGVEFDYGYKNNNNNNNNNNQQFLPHSYGGSDNVSKYMQRSFSSNCFEGKKPVDFQFHNHCDSTLNLDSSNFQGHEFSSPERSSFNGQMRRVCSTGDLQKMKGNNASQTEGSLLEEPNLKVGRYSAEERKERISKYRAKRSQRNFNKTIKYACRKTLADNRPRIRGRFARNDDAVEIPKAPCSIPDDEDVDFWIEGLQLHEEQEEITLGAEQQYMNHYGSTEFQCYRF